jgi:hypothetical protein
LRDVLARLREAADARQRLAARQVAMCKLRRKLERFSQPGGFVEACQGAFRIGGILRAHGGSKQSQHAGLQGFETVRARQVQGLPRESDCLRKGSIRQVGPSEIHHRPGVRERIVVPTREQDRLVQERQGFGNISIQRGNLAHVAIEESGQRVQFILTADLEAAP